MEKERMFKKPAKSVSILTIVLVLSCVGVAVAAYEITSNIVTVTVTAPQAQLTLVSSATQVVGGTPITLTATLNDFANGVTVNFYDGGANVGTSTTGGGGIATLVLTPSVGVHNYHAIATHP
jgi:hypothetical protein